MSIMSKLTMASDSVHTLPPDLFYLLSQELSERSDFQTLYNCAVSSKQLASSGAISALYRISHLSPVKGGGEGLPLAEQGLTVQRWSILWRTITLSVFGKTIYPYCRYLRILDLRDLADLLDEDKFRGDIADHFFSGEMAQFRFEMERQNRARPPRLDTKRIITAIGDVVTQHAPLLEAVSEPANYNILSNALLLWTPRLSNLRSLDFWDGKALANETIRDLLHTHCPNLSSLRMYLCMNDDADHALATFISGMKENSLTYFENIGFCHIGAETCLALNSHGRSLRSLKLGLEEDGILALALLQGCVSLEVLSITALASSVDLKATQNDIYLEIVEWLKNCTHLQDISFLDVVSAPDLLLPVLLHGEIALQKLQINAKEGSMYKVNDHHDFHQVLGQQTSLRTLLLRADPEPPSRDDVEVLLNSFCALENLRELRLTRLSDYFSDEHLVLLARCLPYLEDLYIGGYAISDAALPPLAKLAWLKYVTFSGVTVFTVDGLSKFVDELGEGNNGMSLSIDNADPDAAISEDDQDLVRALLTAKVDGRFEYQLLRDPNLPEFDSEDSD